MKSYSAVTLKTINKSDSLTGQSTLLLILLSPEKALKMDGLPLDHFSLEPHCPSMILLPSQAVIKERQEN